MEFTEFDLEYNTARPKMLIPEYGRNVQKMVDFAITIQDREERNRVANAIIKVMGELKQHLRDDEDYTHKLWTHLFIMSNFELDVDSPYPIPNQETINTKPSVLGYPQSRIRYGHYGKTVEKMIKTACDMPKGDERTALIHTSANLMKKFHLMYNSNSIEDNVIAEHIKRISNGQINLNDLSFMTPTHELLRALNYNQNKRRSNNNNRNNNNNNRRNNNNNNRRNNNNNRKRN